MSTDYGWALYYYDKWASFLPKLSLWASIHKGEFQMGSSVLTLCPKTALHNLNPDTPQNQQREP